MTSITKVRKQREKLNCPKRLQELNRARQQRLKALVDKHGIDLVAEACGYSISTLRQYIRVSIPVSIGEDSVRQAEAILSEL